MMDDLTGNVVELSDADLELVAAGKGVNVNLSNLVNLNVNVNVQTANQISVLSKGVLQNIGQGIGVGQTA
jgi:hypothetical protein